MVSAARLERAGCRPMALRRERVLRFTLAVNEQSRERTYPDTRLTRADEFGSECTPGSAVAPGEQAPEATQT